MARRKLLTRSQQKAIFPKVRRGASLIGHEISKEVGMSREQWLQRERDKKEVAAAKVHAAKTFKEDFYIREGSHAELDGIKEHMKAHGRKTSAITKVPGTSKFKMAIAMRKG